VRRRLQLAAAVAMVAVLGVVAAAVATGGGHKIREQLTGYAEQPLALSTPGTGKFEARFNRFTQEIKYRLSYSDLEAPVTQAHIHFGAENQVGGVSVFLCTNLGNSPVPAQACPAAPATITGTIRPADIIGPAGQGIAPGEFDELINAIEAGATYVNVHSTKYPVGEIRSQIGDDDRGRGDH
jgi:hypothetical protein